MRHSEAIRQTNSKTVMTKIQHLFFQKFFDDFLNLSLQVDKKRPVMIWIHGGAFLTGFGVGNDVPINQVKCIR